MLRGEMSGGGLDGGADEAARLRGDGLGEPERPVLPCGGGESGEPGVEGRGDLDEVRGGEVGEVVGSLEAVDERVGGSGDEVARAGEGSS